jgi:hypothetical protein
MGTNWAMGEWGEDCLVKLAHGVARKRGWLR